MEDALLTGGDSTNSLLSSSPSTESVDSQVVVQSSSSSNLEVRDNTKSTDKQVVAQPLSSSNQKGADNTSVREPGENSDQKNINSAESRTAVQPFASGNKEGGDNCGESGESIRQSAVSESDERVSCEDVYSCSPSLEVSGRQTENTEEKASPASREETQENASSKGVLDVLGNGQLIKKVLKAGRDSSRPVSGFLVTVRIKTCLDSGVCVQDETNSFILSDGDVITAVDMCVALMDEGEVAEIRTFPRFAYGDKGRDPDIPPDSHLTLTLELLQVQGQYLNTLSVEERLVLGEKKRERGNTLFANEDFSGAINSYSKSVTLLEANGGMSGDTCLLQQILDCKVKCYNNMGAAQLKIGATSAALKSCEEVLKIQPHNVKALYRLAKGHKNEGETGKAISVLKKAIKLDPESKLLHKELSLLTHRQKREVESERTMYKKMMGPLADAALQADKGSSNWLFKWPVVVGGMVAAASVGLAYYRSTH